jgi:hypothetical protein
MRAGHSEVPLRTRARHIVGVVGSAAQEHRERAHLLGRLLAERGCDLLTDGRAGVARSVAEAFVTTPGRTGLSLAVCPGELGPSGHRPLPGPPHAFVELAVHTPLPPPGAGAAPSRRVRKGAAAAPGGPGVDALVVLSAHALVLLPGEEEVEAAALLAARLQRPALLYGPATAFAALPDALERTAALARVGDFLFEALAR